MESKPLLKLLARALTTLVNSGGPILPTSIQDLEPQERQRLSSPPSPCKEVVVLDGFGARVPQQPHASYNIV